MPAEATAAARPVIVAISASGHAAVSLEHLLAQLLPLPQAAVMVVVQHREALD